MSMHDLIGLLLGAAIGAGFAAWQWQAQARSSAAPSRVGGSLTRVALLLMALAAVQVFFPSASLWWITTGLVAVMILPMSWRLRRMLASR